MEAIYYDQLDKLAKQVTKCPDEIYELERYTDEETGLATDEYLQANWRASQQHCMMNVVLRVKQIESKSVALSGGRSKVVCNIYATNGSLCELQITAWEPYSELLEGLEKGKVYLFSNVYLKDVGNSFIGSTGYGLSYRFGSDVRLVEKRPENE